MPDPHAMPRRPARTDRRVPPGGGIALCFVCGLVGAAAAIVASLGGAGPLVAFALYIAVPPAILALAAIAAGIGRQAGRDARPCRTHRVRYQNV